MSIGSDVIIPLAYSKNMDDLSDYLLKTRCSQIASKKQAAVYKTALKAKGIETPLDLRKKDLRWWPRIQQSITKIVVVNENVLPGCITPEEQKPAVPASQPAKPVEPKPIEVKPIEVKTEPVPVKAPTKIKPVRKPPTKAEGKTLIP